MSFSLPLRPLQLAITVGALTLAGCSDSDSNNSGNNGNNNGPSDTQALAISQIYPTNEQSVDASQVVISGQLDAADVASLSITLDGTTQDITPAQNFVVSVDAKAGLNSYTINTQDNAGNTSSYQGSFYLGQRAAAGGSHSGAIVAGKTYTWGRNNLGQLGLGTFSRLSDNSTTDPDTGELINPNAHPLTPSLLPSGDNFIALAFNQNASLALDANGDVWAWGDGDDGQLGLGQDEDPAVVDETDHPSPVKVAALSNIISVVRGYDHSMALDASGMVWTFGDNSSGQLGDGTTDDRDFPKALSLSNIVQISAGSRSSYALDKSGQIWAWGRNSYGNLGQGNETVDASNHTPQQVSIDAKIVEIATGRDHVLALADNGQVYAWGLNASNQAGPVATETIENEIHTPQALPWFTASDSNPVMAVGANANQSFVLRADGKTYPWGQNLQGSLGVEAEGDVAEPQNPIFGLENINSMGNGALHGVAIRNDNKVFAWGWSFEGSLGGGASTIDRWSYRIPVLVALPEAP